MKKKNKRRRRSVRTGTSIGALKKKKFFSTMLFPVGIAEAVRGLSQVFKREAFTLARVPLHGFRAHAGCKSHSGAAVVGGCKTARCGTSEEAEGGFRLESSKNIHTTGARKGRARETVKSRRLIREQSSAWEDRASRGRKPLDRPNEIVLLHRILFDTCIERWTRPGNGELSYQVGCFRRT